MNEIRLACMLCDREDYDGTTEAEAVAAGWQDIGEATFMAESQWWTHLGYCSTCQTIAEEYRREEEANES